MLTAALTQDHRRLVLRSTDGRSRVKDLLASLAVDVPTRRLDGDVVVPLDAAGSLLNVGESVEWEPGARRAVSLRQEIQLAAPAVLQQMVALRDGPLDEARATIADSPMVDRLDAHQVRNVAAMTLPDSWGTCVFDEQGTGKTVTLISTFDLLVERNLADILLVVAPKSMIAEWAVEFDRFTNGLYAVAVADGPRKGRVSAIRSGADVIVMSYETVVALADEVVRLARRGRVVLAVDESFNAKNPDARRTGALMRVREHCARAFVLCGTPAPNAGADLISQFNLVDLGLTFGGLHLPKDREAANVAVRSRLDERGFYLRSLKDRVLTLPGREFVTVDVHLAGEQRRAYDAALADLVLDLREASDEEFAGNITNFLARRSMLIRICSDPNPVIPGYSEVPAKIRVLDEMLKNILTRGDKVVLWSFYRSTLDLLAGRYAQHGLVRVDGSVSSPARREAVRRFQEDPAVRVFVGNPAAAGAGLTLTAARVAIYESLGNQAAHYMQSLDRIHRRGQENSVEYYFLVSCETIEVSEQRRLLDKAEYQGDLLRDDLEPPINRRAMLDELLAGDDGCA